jgi:hypothetical protein
MKAPDDNTSYGYDQDREPPKTAQRSETEAADFSPDDFEEVDEATAAEDEDATGAGRVQGTGTSTEA